MFFTITGNVVSVERNVKGTKLSIVTILAPYSGQTITDGEWGKRENGFFQLKVWETNMQTGLNVNFVKFLDTLKKGSTVEALVEGTDQKTIKGGKTVERTISLTAHRFSYVGGSRESNGHTASAESSAEQDGFEDVDIDEDYVPDPFA